MRVLLVEDEERLAAAVARGLTAEGMDVDVVHDGLDGLWRAREQTYDVIVLDILLPGLNGYKLCQQLRDEEVSVPILMLTAKDGEYDEADALDLGADDFLRKPFSFVVLVARLRALARRGVSARAGVLEAGAMTFDLARRRARVDGEPVELTPREASLLEALLRRPNEVVPKTQLIELVWGFDFDGDPNIVEVYVGYLRRKLGVDRIQTVRGVGYRLRTSDEE